VGESNLRLFISEYYKRLVGPPEQNHFSLLEDINSDIPKLSIDESNILIADWHLGQMDSPQNSIRNFGR
jgi:hypothetical protein